MQSQKGDAIRLKLEQGRTITRGFIRHVTRRLHKPPLPPNEQLFRKHYKMPSHAATRAFLKLTIYEHARDTLRADQAYKDRKTNFEYSVAGDKKLAGGFDLNVRECEKHIAELKAARDAQCALFVEVHATARHFHPDIIPEILNEEFLGKVLFRELKAATLFTDLMPEAETAAEPEPEPASASAA